MNCKTCGAIVAENSKFCNQCGTKVKAGPFEKWLTFPWGVLFGGGSVLIVVAVIMIINFFSGEEVPAKKFEQALQNDNTIEAMEIYHKVADDPVAQAEVEEVLSSSIQQVKDQFLNGEMEYYAAANRLELMAGTNLSAEADEALKELDVLGNSRDAFSAGMQLLEQNLTRAALEQLQLVVENDYVHFSQAQELIRRTTEEHRNVALQEADRLALDNNHEAAIASLREALELVPEDSELKTKKIVYESQHAEKLRVERKAKMEELESQQQVLITKSEITIDRRGSNILINTIKNLSDKTTQRVSMGVLAFDPEGQPIEMEAIGSDYLLQSSLVIKVEPGETVVPAMGFLLKGSGLEFNKYWVCVRAVTYTDGTEWTNEYYEYWLEEYKQKPL